MTQNTFDGKSVFVQVMLGAVKLQAITWANVNSYVIIWHY